MCVLQTPLCTPCRHKEGVRPKALSDGEAEGSTRIKAAAQRGDPHTWCSIYGGKRALIMKGTVYRALVLGCCCDGLEATDRDDLHELLHIACMIRV